MNSRAVHIILASTVVWLMLSCCMFASGQTKPLVIVAGIDITAPGVRWESSLPHALTDLMVNALINSNRFRVLERRSLETIITEQGFQHASGLVDSSTAVELGRMLGASLVVTGSVTEVSGTSTGRIQVGFIRVGSSSLRVTLAIRIVDVKTGEILYSIVERKRQSASDVGLSLTGGLGGYSQTSLSVISTVHDLCEIIVEGFIEQMDERLAELGDIPLEGYVVAVRGESIYLNLDQMSGIQVGQVVRIYREGESIRDPRTGQVLDRELIPVADARVFDVRDRLSEAEILRTHHHHLFVAEEDIVVVAPDGETTIDVLLSELSTRREHPESVREVQGVPVAQAVEAGVEPEIYVVEEPEPVDDLGAGIEPFPEEMGEQIVIVAEPQSPPPAEDPLQGEFEGRTVQIHHDLYPGGTIQTEYTYYLEDGSEVLHGWYRRRYENDQLRIEGTYRDGVRDGLWREYMRNGTLVSEGVYQANLREGPWVIYYESGNKQHEGSYLSGRKQGTWKNFINSASGMVFSQVDYDADQEVAGTYIEYDQFGNVVQTR